MSDQPKRVRLNPITVAGLSIRTTYALERDPASARIPNLWQRFQTERLAERMTDGRTVSDVVAVYYDYQSDHQGAYSLLVGLQVGDSTLPDIDLSQRPAFGVADLEAGIIAPRTGSPMTSVVTEAGDYLVFEARGQMPQALIDCWQRIWRYFEGASVRRAFQTDIEIHRPESVEVHIGIREP